MSEKSNRAAREEGILSFWKENQIFEETLKKDSPKGDFVFYEGPPTANGRPAIHHLEARSFKDAIPRYKTMQGYRVPRKAGWDTHGLPVELEVEKELGIKNKKEIELFGIAEFNKRCRESVLKYIDEWAKFTDRIGYWTNLKEAYFTYDNSYIQAVWGVLAHVDRRKLLYKDYKVLPWCPRCGTALSSHELAQGYKDVKDLSVYVKFKVKGEGDTYLLAWTTTPWTLPGNVALAVGENLDYVKVKYGEEILILAGERISVLEGEHEILEKLDGRDLVGLEYESLYPFLKENYQGEGLDKAYKVYAADFVNTEDGTGIVHTAVMYGQDDFVLGTKIGLPKYHLVDETGHFTKETGFLAGKSVVEEETAVEIIKDLAHRGLLFKKEKHEHSYPFCWRCKTRLIYYARNSWYIKMSALREDLVRENEKIHWEPEHIKHGRFGEWLREVKDWAISRERYWGTPLPIWESITGKRLVVSSVEEMAKLAKTNGNSYFLMRHGDAENNKHRVVSVKAENNHHLTREGKQKVMRAAEELRDEKIDLIVASPFIRTRETSALVAEVLGVPESAVIYDDRLREFDAGDFEGKSEDELHEYFHTNNLFENNIPGGESFLDAKRRLGEALEDIDKTYKNKTILIITHKVCAWLLVAAAKRLDAKKAEELDVYLKNAEVIPLPTPVLPHDENFNLDLHKPFIDHVILEKNGEEYTRVKEVMDVWFDSGSMPFAQDAGRRADPTDFGNILHPADFISEGVDQTRGWFYTLHAISILMERGVAFKNAICLGLIMDKEGKKMSKSVGNVLDPWELMEKFGVDVLRYWMYSVNQPGEPKNFDEATVVELNRKVFNLLDNVHAFYELYRDEGLETGEPTLVVSHALDKWILTRLGELIELMTAKLDDYKLMEPTRALKDFIDDLSTWYVRRSRERLKEGDKEAKQTLYFVLKTVTKLLAPFAPFAAEELYQKLRTGDDALSVHLTSWPEAGMWGEPNIIKDMEETRRIVSLALEERSKANIKVRQPLAELKIKANLKEEFLAIIGEELNVKSVAVDETLSTETLLNTDITPELAEEGEVREAIREIQDMRKEKGLKPQDKMSYDVPSEKGQLFKKYAEEIKKATNIEF